MAFEGRDGQRRDSYSKEQKDAETEIIPKQNFSGKSIEDVLRTVEGFIEIGAPRHTPLAEGRVAEVCYSYQHIKRVRPDLIHSTKLAADSAYKVIETSEGKKVLVTDAFGNDTCFAKKIEAGDFCLKGEKHIQQKEWYEAIPCFNKAMDLDNTFVKPFLEKAYCSYKIGIPPEKVLGTASNLDTNFNILFSDVDEQHNFYIHLFMNKEFANAVLTGTERFRADEERKRRADKDAIALATKRIQEINEVYDQIITKNKTR